MTLVTYLVINKIFLLSLLHDFKYIVHDCSLSPMVQYLVCVSIIEKSIENSVDQNQLAFSEDS